MANLDARTRGPNRYPNSTMSPTVVLDGAKVRLVIGGVGTVTTQGGALGRRIMSLPNRRPAFTYLVTVESVIPMR